MPPISGDNEDMKCDAYREAISARIDGEDVGLEPPAIDAHLATCAACRAWADAAIGVTRAARVGVAETVPDLSRSIMATARLAAASPRAGGVRSRAGTRPGQGRGKAGTKTSPGRAKGGVRPGGAGSAERPGRGRVGAGVRPGRSRVQAGVRAASPVGVARLGLLMVAAFQFLVAVPALLGRDPGASIYVAHEQGSWALALAVGLFVVAARPARAAGLLPIVAALAAGLAVSMVVDISAGRTQAAAVAPDCLAFLGLGLLWVLSRQARNAPQPGGMVRAT